tara:strand:+ start:318 stop:1058 length:741 start_codon:yes stop_codon:yes gene_type:complete
MPDKNQFTAHAFHDVDVSLRDWPDVVRVISIDPGIRNLAIRVESRGIRSSNHPMRTIVFEKLKISDADRNLNGNVDQLYFLVNQFLDQYLDVFKTCHIMIIERQLPMNLKAVRISQHIITYFMMNLKNIPKSLPMIFEIDAKMKSREMGASTHLNERGIKQWSIDFCKSLLVKRQDYDALAILEKHKRKADDLSDCVTQIEAFFSFQGWPLTQEIQTLKLVSNKTEVKTENKEEKKTKLVLKVVEN